jgi:hypothetical protein
LNLVGVVGHCGLRHAPCLLGSLLLTTPCREPCVQVRQARLQDLGLFLDLGHACGCTCGLEVVLRSGQVELGEAEFAFGDAQVLDGVVKQGLCASQPGGPTGDLLGETPENRAAERRVAGAVRGWQVRMAVGESTQEPAKRSRATHAVWQAHCGRVEWTVGHDKLAAGHDTQGVGRGRHVGGCYRDGVPVRPQPRLPRCSSGRVQVDRVQDPDGGDAGGGEQIERLPGLAITPVMDTVQRLLRLLVLCAGKIALVVCGGAPPVRLAQGLIGLLDGRAGPTFPSRQEACLFAGEPGQLARCPVPVALRGLRPGLCSLQRLVGSLLGLFEVCAGT